MKRAAIVAVGTELTTGFVHDINIHYLSAELDSLGYEVCLCVMIPDDYDLMREQFLQAMGMSELVVVTGGLGPTPDDFTKEVLLELFGDEWIEDVRTLEHIERLLEERNLPLTDANRMQARIPSQAKVLPNAFGMAPGTAYLYEGGILVSLPGVPSEMRGIFMTELKPLLLRLENSPVIRKQIYVFGVAESLLADRLEEWNRTRPEGMSLAFLPSPGIVCLRISYNPEYTSNTIATRHIEKLYKHLADIEYLETEGSLVAYVIERLAAKAQTLSVAESCTGGGLSGYIVAVSGASQVYRGGLCAYTDAIKEQELKIAPRLITEYTAVSEPVARCMAEEIRTKFGTTYGLATTGYMEFEDGHHGLYTGEVYIGLATETKTQVVHFMLNQDREGNITHSIQRAILLILKELLAF